MQAVIIWLATPEGEAWSHNRITSTEQGGNPTRHSHGLFASIKYDHESCHYDQHAGVFRDCYPPFSNFSYTDDVIRKEMMRYGMNGVPNGAFDEPNTSAA